MSEDLVKRLRAGCVTGNYEGLKFIESAKSNATMNEAADRIEKLETALRELSTDWDCCVVSKNMKDIAHKALEGKDD